MDTQKLDHCSGKLLDTGNSDNHINYKDTKTSSSNLKRERLCLYA